MKRLHASLRIVLGTYILTSLASAAQADCTTNGNTVTCSGDVMGQTVLDQGEALKVENLSSDINQGLVFFNQGANADSSSNGDPGQPGQDLTYSFNGGAHGINWNGRAEPTLFYFGTVVQTEGGNAASGDHSTEFGGDAHGDPGGVGGNGGSATMTFQSGTVHLTNIFEPALTTIMAGAQSDGGEGGAGGDATVDTGGAAYAGDGNAGGLGGNVSTTVSSGTLFLDNGVEGGFGAYAFSEGGEGGAGGRGKTSTGNAHGGDGGVGGMGYAASVTVENATIHVDAISGSAVFAKSLGGAGGAGGEAEPGGGDAFAGNGGYGGDASAATAVLSSANAVLSTSGGATAVIVHSEGGAGGVGGEAKSGAGDAHGRDGGNGGAGGDVSLVLGPADIAVLDTTGAIFLQSYGGQGGKGGEGESVASSTSFGGDGGTGGQAGKVTVTKGSGPAQVQTISSQHTQHAIVLQSVAGDGGDGGDARADTFGDADAGNGGAGGHGGDIDADIWANVSTDGPQSQAVFARSYGGAGGNGGSANAVIDSGNGGAGAGSGPAGDVKVTFEGSISTRGTEANGILVQSVGGFSGNGGSATGFDAYGAGSQSAGHGGTVSLTVNNNTGISTEGEYAYGVQAQSVGGGGGRGGSAVGLASLGGDGSAGGNGSNVTVNIEAGSSVATTGDFASGVHASSIGGGGGDGGASLGIVSLGGAGGSGGNGDTVQVNNDAKISTEGKDAAGIFAASVGGGGGSANTSAGVLTIGGSGGDGGSGGVVMIDNSDLATTKGDDSDAVFAHSVGGGGGHGSNAVSVSGGFSMSIGGAGGSGGFSNTVTYTDSGNAGRLISTEGDRSRGVFLQSVGGSGGDGGTAVALGGVSPVSITLGMSGQGGGGGNGGMVEYLNGVADIQTKGTHSSAIHVQSLGGGGGNAGSDFTASAGSAVDLNVAIGSAGGDGGDGAYAAVESQGSMTTAGDNSSAIVVQSIGGGGGNAGTTLAGSATAAASLSTAIGGSGGSGGKAAPVYADGGGGVTTGGHNSAGLLVQSIGGGGGNGATTISASGVSLASGNASVGGSGGSGGSSDTATVSWGDAISTNGDNSAGVVAQSIGGGGGHSGTTVAAAGSSMYSAQVGVGGSGGTGGHSNNVTVKTFGDISTTGDISSGVLAQSIGGGGGHSGATIAATAISNGTLNFSVGGSGGSGGDAMAVQADVANISTQGHSSSAVSAMSIGGGGGSSHFTGAFSGESQATFDGSVGGKGGIGGAAGKVTVTANGTLATEGHNSAGVKALSVGGGGGDSGVTASGSLESNVGLGVSVGGHGGDGGTADTVDVTTASGTAITTKGDASEGITAASVAGGGGTAGYVFSGSAISTGAGGVSVGGDGGSGGTSAKVTVTNGASITTEGALSSAIEARSVAGGGGSSKGSITGDALSMADVSITVGGSGGDGGTAGDVEVSSTGAKIETKGVQAAAILAQSIGGTGGNGGYAAEGSLTGGEYSGQLGVSIGGSGGNGGQSGTVSVTTGSQVTTDDLGSSAIVAQSIGGAGGNVYSGNISLSSSASVSADVNVGGEGGDGAKGSNVSVENTGSLHTSSYLADVVLAQSIGGNGGSGGSVFTVLASINQGSSGQLDVNVGGSGGSGQDAGTVSVTNASGAIITAGNGGSNGISAMSVGGGGGKGGNAANIILQPAPSSSGGGNSTSVSASINVGIGGTGGAAGDGNSVKVVNDGLIDVGGDSSKGIYALSVGGGGGTGGTASSTSISYDGVCNAATGGTGYACSPSGNSSESTTVSASLTSTVGGSGGAAGNGGAVDISTGTDASIATSGRLGHAIVAHSIGGGGGDGAEGSLGIEAWTSNETADSIANLPGNFTFIPDFNDVSMSIGGTGGAAGDGGAVSVTGAARVVTQGDHAFGIHAQSIGGGGGNGGAGSTGLWSEATVGGLGSGGGNGGDVSVKQGGSIATTGKGSVGIFAQSVGGGGGTSGDVEQAFTDDWLDLNIGAGVAVQSAPGNGGNGGNITVETGAITTTGAAAHGIIAQSVGGSGGIGSVSGDVGANSPNVFAGGAGDGGNGGKIDITTNGAISVSGENAHAIVAQSTTGRLGSGDQAGDVTIAVNNDISATGTGGRAILAQSDGDVRGQIAITVDKGVTVSNGANGAETIGLFHGDANMITNDGTIRHEGNDADDYVIRTNGFGVTVQNNGVLEGSILSASSDPNGPVGGPIAITNAMGAQIGLGGTVNLGGGGFIANSGTISAGTLGTVGITQFTGDLSQTSTGSIQIDYNPGGSNDLITIVSGAQPDLAGAVDPNPLGPALTSGSQGSMVYLTADPGIGSNTLSVQDTSTVNYSLSQNGNDLILSYDVDYAPWNGSADAQAKVSAAARTELTENHTRFANSINDMFAGQPGVSSDFSNDLSNFLLEVPTVTDLLDVYDRFAPTEIFAPTETAFYSSLRFADSLTGCPASVTDGTFGLVDGGNCAWGRLSGASLQRDESLAEYNENTFGLSLGVQTEFSPDWFASAAVEYDRTELSSDHVSGSGDRFHLGAGIKRAWGSTSLSAAFIAGRSDITLDRAVLTPNGTEISSGDPNTTWLGGHLRLAHKVPMTGRSYLRPWLDLGVQRIWQDAYAETGAGDYSLSIGETSNTLFTASPMLEFGTSFGNDSMKGELVLSAGALVVMGDTDHSTWVNMAGAGGAPGYLVTSNMERFNASVNAGLNLQIGRQSTLEATIGALLSEDQQQINGGLRLVFVF